MNSNSVLWMLSISFFFAGKKIYFVGIFFKQCVRIISMLLFKYFETAKDKAKGKCSEASLIALSLSNKDVLPFSSQKFLVLILSISERWKAESTLEHPSGLENRTPGLGIQCLNTRPLLHNCSISHSNLQYSWWVDIECRPSTIKYVLTTNETMVEQGTAHILVRGEMISLL